MLATEMVSPLVLGVVCGASVVIVGIVGVVIYIVYRKRHRSTACVSTRSGYEAVGDCKPSLMSISSSSQEVSISKESRTVQPRSASMSTTSHGSVRSDLITADDTSSISARSDASVDSLVFEANFGAIRPDLYPRKDIVLQQASLDAGHGRLHTRLKYDFRTSDLVVHLIEAQDLPPSELLGGFNDPYIRIALVPSVDERIRQSSVKRRTSNPYYNEYFKFPVAFDDVKDKLLAFHLYDYDKFSRHNVIGQVEIDLSKIEISNSVEMWCDIQKHQQTVGVLGELLISLSYLPTAERLTVVVMKAKDLKVSNNTTTADPYVKVSLLIEGKKVKRKKTSVRRGSVTPVWNEALAFNVPAELFPKVGIEVCVMDHDLIGHGEIIGRCIIGPQRAGSEGSHWDDMIHNQRKSIALWHDLRK